MATLITVQGKVINESDGPLAGVKVIARQEGTEIQQITDQNGNFIFYLVEGQWHISTSMRGYNDSDAYLYRFTAAAPAITLDDFKLTEGYSISGLVIKDDNGKPAPGVLIEAEANINGRPRIERKPTDDYGKFRYSGLPSGEWKIKGIQGELQTSEEKVKVGPDADNVNLVLSREMIDRDWRWGIGFFAALCILLGILIGLYLWTHSRYAPGSDPEIAALISQVKQARRLAAEIKATEEIPEPSLQTLGSTIAALKQNWNSVSNKIISLTEGQSEQVNLLVSSEETAAMAKNLQDVELALATLQSVFENQRLIYFWSQPPNNYLEVLFWSIAGILVSLLITSGYYLRRKRFYAEGVWMHVSHLLGVPLLALVVVFLISQIRLTVQIDESEAALDISDPRVLAAISFTIAVLPWRILNFVQRAASRIFGQVQSRIPGGSET